MFGPGVRRFAVRAGRVRLVAAGVGAAALLGAAAVTAGAQSAPAPACIVNLAGVCVPSPGSTPTPTPTPNQLCLLILCGPTNQTTGTGSTPTPTPTPTPCPVAGTCVPPVNTGCDVTVDPTCLIATPTPCQSGCGTQTPGHTPPPGSHTPRPTSSSTSTSTSSIFSGAFSNGGGGSGQSGIGTTIASSLNVAPVPVVQSVSPVSGVEFGHAPILWPLFGILDVLGLAAVYVLVRRLRSADPD